ncbi:hypothetical protein pb186bvf_005805 [Paramecium bursaria]
MYYFAIFFVYQSQQQYKLFIIYIVFVIIMNNIVLIEWDSFKFKLQTWIYHIKQSPLFQDIMQSKISIWWVIIIIIALFCLSIFLYQKYCKRSEIDQNIREDFQQNQKNDSGLQDKKSNDSKKSRNSISYPQDDESKQLLEQNDQNIDQKTEQQQPIQGESHSIVDIKNQIQLPPQKQCDQKQEDLDLMNKIQVAQNELKPQDDQNNKSNLQIQQDKKQFIQIDSSQKLFEIDELKQNLQKEPQKQEEKIQNQNQAPYTQQQQPNQGLDYSIVDIKNQIQLPPQKQCDQKQEDFDLMNMIQVPENETKPQDDQNNQTNLQIQQDQKQLIQIDSSQKLSEIDELKQNLQKEPQKQEEKIQKSNQAPQLNQNSEINTQQSSEFQSLINQQQNDNQFQVNQFEEIIEESQGKEMIQESSGISKINQAYQILDQRFYIPSFKSRKVDDEVLKKFVRDFKSFQAYKDEYNLDDSQQKILNDQIQLFIPIRGDGNCLFTSIGVLYVYYNLIDDKRFQRLVELINSTEFVQYSKNQDNEILFKIETEEEQNILKLEFLEQIIRIKNFDNQQQLLQQIAQCLNNDEGPFYGLLIIFLRNYFRKLLQDFSKVDEIGYIQNPDQIDKIVTWEYMYNETDIALKLFAEQEKILIRCFQKMNVDDKIVQFSEYKDDELNQFQYKIGLAFQPGHYNAIKLYD